MLGYLMALYSDYKGGTGGMVGRQREGGREGEGRDRKKKILMIELLKLLQQLFLHVKVGDGDWKIPEIQGQGPDKLLFCFVRGIFLHW